MEFMYDQRQIRQSGELNLVSHVSMLLGTYPSHHESDTKYGSESSYVLQSSLCNLISSGILPFHTFSRSRLVTSREDIGSQVVSRRAAFSTRPDFPKAIDGTKVGRQAGLEQISQRTLAKAQACACVSLTTAASPFAM